MTPTSLYAGVVKRSNTADCKSAGLCLRGFESLPLHHEKWPVFDRSLFIVWVGFEESMEAFGVRNASGISQGRTSVQVIARGEVGSTAKGEAF